MHTRMPIVTIAAVLVIVAFASRFAADDHRPDSPPSLLHATHDRGGKATDRQQTHAGAVWSTVMRGRRMPAAQTRSSERPGPVVLTLRELKLEITRQKFLDADNGVVRRRNRIPSRNGSRSLTDEEVARLIQRDRELYQARAGAIHRRFLPAVLEAAKTDQFRRFNVVAWAVIDPAAVPEGPSVETLVAASTDGTRSLLRSHRQRLRLFWPQVTAPLAAEMRRITGRDVRASRIAPVVSAQMTASEILVLARQTALVRTIFQQAEKAVIELASSSCAIGAPTVQALGVNATNVNVVVVEPDRVGPPSQCLDVVAFNGEGNPANHPSGVAGIIGSLLPGVLGVAPGANILSADIGDFLEGGSDIEEAAEWALDQEDFPGQVFNLSFKTDEDGEMESDDVILDSIVRFERRTVVKSAGNIGTPANPGTCFGTNKVTNPGLGFNVITVGNYREDDTDGDGQPGPCILSSNTTPGNMNTTGSCFGDPWSPHHDREKPELAAPGGRITTLDVTSCGLQTSSGTSFAAPHVAGGAALLIARNGVMEGAPEIVKAIFMATAFNNVNGDRRLSESDGAGAIDLIAADRTLQGDDGGWFGKYIGQADLDGSNRLTVLQFEVKPLTQRLKAAVVWDSNPTANDGFTVVNDFDLTVYRNGELIDKSWSYDNSYETVDILNPPQGHYKIVVQAVGGLSGKEHVAAAFSVIEHACADAGGDVDGDGVCGDIDNCPLANSTQADADNDGRGDACDNCPGMPNPDQEDIDHDGKGDVCDDDDDNDGCKDNVDEAPQSSLEKVGTFTAPFCHPSHGDDYAFAGVDTDNDGQLNCQDPDNDGDGLFDANDPCPKNKDNSGLLCTVFKPDCPDPTYDLCLLMPCDGLLVKIVTLTNPDPSAAVVIDQFDVVGQHLFVFPRPGQGLAELASLFASGGHATIAASTRITSGASEPGELRRLEIWTRPDGEDVGRRVGVFAEYDSRRVAIGSLRGGAILRLTPFPGEPPTLGIETVWTVGAAPGPVAADVDGDQIPDFFDNCERTYNPRQKDSDHDGIGDACVEPARRRGMSKRQNPVGPRR
jgi:subtilisin family serine protease